MEFILSRLSHLLLLSCLMFVAAHPVFAGDEADYRLGVGDKVRVDVFGHPELSGELVVNGSGEVVLPLIDGVRATGLTTSALAEHIVWKLKPDYLVNPRVTVTLLSYRPYYIMGEVKNPGSFPYVEGMTVLNAVALAGGYTERANRKKIDIQRKRGKKVRKLRADMETQVEPGDIIIVKERFF